MPKTICITLGDPAGLGPELVCRHFAQARPADRIVLVGPPRPLERTAEILEMERFWQPLFNPGALETAGPGVYLHAPGALSRLDVDPGRPRVEGGQAAGLALSAVWALYEMGLMDALVTCPLNKATLQEAGHDFPGHTEFLAAKSGLSSGDVCMHLGGSRLRVSLVTTHPPLAEVPGLVSAQRIQRCLALTARHLERLGVKKPIAVCGLNPHAGEGGAIGREEIEIITPAVEQAVLAGVRVVGPLPADTLFHRAYEGEFGAVLAMYHDQGLGPLKLVHFDDAVNVTLGLPIVRTSPAHGTGYDLVGTGRASVGSFRAALEMAGLLCGGEQQ
jgi:4-hydroxythreonine-4-phosphate dehydrogenase